MPKLFTAFDLHPIIGAVFDAGGDLTLRALPDRERGQLARQGSS
jgi:hypothetical protein